MITPLALCVGVNNHKIQSKLQLLFWGSFDFWGIPALRKIVCFDLLVLSPSFHH